MAKCLISLGSNTGEREAYLRRALDLLAQTAHIEVIRVSSFYGSQAVGGPAGQPAFVNAAAVLETSLSPESLLMQTQGIELALGRIREERWGPRTLDIDLLLYEAIEIDEPNLVIPHPRLAVRQFMLVPATEIGPNWIYPNNGWPLQRLLFHLRTTPRRVNIYSTGNQQAESLALSVASRLGSAWEFVFSGPTNEVADESVRFGVIFIPPDELSTAAQAAIASLRTLSHRPEMCPTLWIGQLPMESAVGDVVAACEATESSCEVISPAKPYAP